MLKTTERYFEFEDFVLRICLGSRASDFGFDLRGLPDITMHY